MIVVSNATPLIGLAQIGRFSLLNALFEKIIIPRAVYQETVERGHSAKRFVLDSDWIVVEEVANNQLVRFLSDELDRGEAETIALAKQLSADLVLMDEKKGRRQLMQMRLHMVGTAGILLRAKQKGLIAEIEPDLRHLQQVGFGLSNRVVEAVLSLANEED